MFRVYRALKYVTEYGSETLHRMLGNFDFENCYQNNAVTLSYLKMEYNS